jgi:hypothetical protein
MMEKYFKKKNSELTHVLFLKYQQCPQKWLNKKDFSIKSCNIKAEKK